MIKVKITEFTYRCNRHCPIGRNCFVLKTKEKLKMLIVVLQKCKAEKKDIQLIIGERH